MATDMGYDRYAGKKMKKKEEGGDAPQENDFPYVNEEAIGPTDARFRYGCVVRFRN